MRRHFWFSTAIAGISAACLFVADPARAQEDVPAGPTRPDQIKIFQVHRDVASLANTLAYLSEGTAVQVMTDTASNSIILRGPSDALESMAAVIQRLDQPIRQVEVRLLVAELAGSSDATPEFDADFDVAVAQVRKLQTEGDATVLKRIQLASLENKPATVQVGETQALAVGENFGPGGRQPQRSYQMQDMGTLVEVTPRVAVDGTVFLDLSFELTRLAPTRRPEPNEADPFVPQGRVTAVLKSSLAVPNGRTVTVTDFASAATPEDARLIMLLSARVVE